MGLEHRIVTPEEMERELVRLRSDLRGLSARMPRSTGRSIGDRHDHQELRGRRVADTEPSANQVLKWNATLRRWQPASAGGGGGTAHVIQEDAAPLPQRDSMNFRQGIVAVDDADNNASRIDADFAVAGDLQAAAATASAGTDTRLTRGGHIHPGAYTDVLARAAVPFTIYVPLGNSIIGQTHAPA